MSDSAAAADGIPADNSSALAPPAGLSPSAGLSPQAGLSPRAWWYYLIFAASGFAGLIYESIWARYLKSFLGHAAYAQALALAIFLLGLAVGAALAGKYSARISRPLAVYAAIEAIVALAAIYFHEIFLFTYEWAFFSAVPELSPSPLAVESLKWILAGILILPQSILLGATFPLMSAGLVRIFPRRPGEIVAWLYFANSFGAAMGALAAGFFLVDALGLPGALTVAGILNAAVAAAVWAIGQRTDDSAPPLAESPLDSSAPRRFAALILSAAALTGIASFIYEIAWLRMLALLLGSSTRAFELMLAAFILGLALGGFWIRRRADASANPLRTLGFIQLAMGTLAISTLFFYQELFSLLEWILQFLPRTPSGYLRYNILSAGFALLVMLPTAACAGMTLPLLTRALISVGGGEKAIGRVYAANTAGAILAVFAASLILLPILGLKGTMIVGGGIDLALGVFLLAKSRRRESAFGFGFAAAVLCAGIFLISFDPAVISSGVFRSGKLQKNKVVFHRDGKTATISVFEGERKNGNRWRNIVTNGKPDANLIVNSESEFTTDEMTMFLSGALPLLVNPEAKKIANVGFGSGLTTHTMLHSPTISQIDTIEIEQAVIDGAKNFGDKTARAFEDSRSRIHIADARTFFLSRSESYDVIISEPSNPWVSGIAGLFSREFYRVINSRLADGGVFMQWTHLYESRPEIFASIVLALAEHFSDFRLYLSNSADVIILAVKDGKVPPLSDKILEDAEVREFFSRYRLTKSADADALFLGDRDLLMPYFESFRAPPNSDYFPYIESRAAESRFMKTTYALARLRTALKFPMLEMMAGKSPPPEFIADNARSPIASAAAAARRQLENADNPPDNQDGEFGRILKELNEQPCPQTYEHQVDILSRLTALFGRMLPNLPPNSRRQAAEKLQSAPCFSAFDDSTRPLAEFWLAIALGDLEGIIAAAELLLPPQGRFDESSTQTVALAKMTAHYNRGEYQQILNLTERFPTQSPAAIRHALRLLGSHAVAKLAEEI